MTDSASPAVVDLMSLIDVRAEALGGRPSFVGTRVTVYDVLEYLAADTTSDEIMTDFPELNVDHVRAAFKFAAVGEHGRAAPA